MTETTKVLATPSLPGDSMGFRSWLLRNRLQTVERKLRKKRFLMKRLRDRVDKAEGDKTKLEAERHRITAEIEVLSTKEKQLKEELRIATQ